MTTVTHGEGPYTRAPRFWSLRDVLTPVPLGFGVCVAFHGCWSKHTNLWTFRKWTMEINCLKYISGEKHYRLLKVISFSLRTCDLCVFTGIKYILSSSVT